MDWKITLLGMEGEVLDAMQRRVEGGACLDAREKDFLLILQNKAQLMLAERLEAFYALQTKETAPESATGTELAPGGPSGDSEADIVG